MSTTTSPIRVLSVKNVYAVKDLTENEGPVVVGICHSDYTVTEIKEAIEQIDALDIGNLKAQEEANRLVRVLGIFSGAVNQYLNDGRPIKTRLNWLLPAGASVCFFIYNEDASPLTTGAIFECDGDIWAVPG